MLVQDPFEPYPLPAPRFAGMAVSSFYLPVRDGIRLAADLYLPAGLSSAERVPTILYQTRYWRASQPRGLLRWLAPGEGDAFPVTRRGKEFFVRRGYALLFVDVRGTGASFGVCRHPWEAITVQDAADMMDWIARQPWSDGQVVGAGLSFLGTTAELLLATRHPALRTVIPQFNHPDPYTDIAMPGGLFNRRFVHAWTELNAALDRNQNPRLYGRAMNFASQGVRPVGGAAGLADLLAAVREHQANGGLKDLEVEGAFRDECHPVAGYSLDDQAVMRFRDALMESRLPVYGWASWLDAGTANAALRRFLTLPGPQLAVIGAWNHGGANQSSPYQHPGAPLSPPYPVQQRELLRFLDRCTQAPDRGAGLEKTVYYYTLGAETWQKSPTWPPEGTHMERWFFGPDSSLAPQPPDSPGADEYTVDYRASTGPFNRWWELGVVQRKPVDYGNRAAQKPYLLGYESAPLERDLEITGTPVVTLWGTSSEPDCAFFVYLEDVFPDGRIACVTEGQLRSIHRRVRPPAESPYRLLEPYHTFRQEDVLPLVPGQPAEITFGLLPISVRISRGHRLRVSLAGHDEGTFPRTPGHGTPVWQVARGSERGSSILLPVVP